MIHNISYEKCCHVFIHSLLYKHTNRKQAFTVKEIHENNLSKLVNCVHSKCILCITFFVQLFTDWLCVAELPGQQW